jgi:hypothetical protein
MADDHVPGPGDSTGRSAPWAPPPGASAASGPLLASSPIVGNDEEPSPRRRPWPVLLGAAALAVVLVGGAVWFALGAARSSGGADSPEEVVDELVAALNDEDFITLAELLDPAERRSVATPLIEDITPELVRVGLLSDDLDLAEFGGVDIDIDDLEFEIVPTAHTDLFHARLTGGTTSATVTPDELPLDDVFLDEIPSETTTGSGAIEDDPDGPVLAIVDRDGRWYLSLWHTIGESVRMAAGVELPDLADLPVAVGADSPDEAVEQMLGHVADLDLDGLIGVLDPEEADALYRYVGLVLDDYDAFRDEAMSLLDDEEISWELSDLEFDVDRAGDTAAVALSAGRLDVTFPQGRASADFDADELRVEVTAADEFSQLDVDLVVRPPSYELSGSYADDFDSVTFQLEMLVDADEDRVTVTGEINGEPLEAGFAIDPDGECSEAYLRFEDTDESGCYEDLVADGTLPAGIDNGPEQWIDQLAMPGSLRLPPATVHQVDGRWYVAPVTTAMDWMTRSLQSVEDDAYAELFEAFLELETTLGDDMMSDVEDDFFTDDPFEDDPFEDDPFADDPFEDDPFEDDPFEDDVLVPDQAPVFVEVAAGGQTEVDVELGPATAVVVLQAPAGTQVSVGVPETLSVDPIVEVLDGDLLLAYNDDFGDLGFSSGVTFTMPETGEVEIRIDEYSGLVGATVARISAGTPDTPPIDPGVLLGP